MDIGLDFVGFVPFGDFARLGKVGWGALKGVKIPMNALDFGAKAADSWKRADGIIDAVGGTAKYGDDAAQWAQRTLTGQAHAIHVTADTFKDRLNVAVARHFGDANLYRAGTGLTDALFQKAMPNLIENTPLRNIPHLADSVKPVVDNVGNTVGKYIDPRSWTARGYEAAMGTKNLYKEGVRYATEEVQYKSEQVREQIQQARDTAGRLVSPLSDFG